MQVNIMTTKLNPMQSHTYKIHEWIYNKSQNGKITLVY